MSVINSLTVSIVWVLITVIQRPQLTSKLVLHLDNFSGVPPEKNSANVNSVRFHISGCFT